MDPDNLDAHQIISSSARTESDHFDDDPYSRRSAMYKEIRLFGDPILKTRASEVETFDDALRSSVERMRRLVDSTPTYGLASNQVGALHRIFVYHVESEDPILAVVNPVIEWSSKETETEMEACFSLPGVAVEVERAVAIRLRSSDEFGVETVRELSGLEARVIQHEYDHLDGILILDRATREERRDAMRFLRDEAMRYGS